MSTPHEDIERYLRRATRGLWGRRRREVREELLAHIDERVLAHRIGGSSEATAVERALAELGDPVHVRAGMVRLHSLPTLAGLGAALATACVVVLSLGQGSFAQKIAPSFKNPTSECVDVGPDSPSNLQSQCFTPRPWISVEALRETLEPQGVGVTWNAPLVNLDFPGGDTVALVESAGRTLREQSSQPGYLDAYGMLHEIVQQSGLPVTLKGWKSLSVRVGDVVFELDLVPDEPGYTMEYPTPLWGFIYWDVTQRLAQSHLTDRGTRPDAGVRFGNFGLHHRSTTFDVAAEQGDVYAFIALLDAEALGLHRAPEPVEVAIAMNISPANDDGTVTLDVPQADLTWVDAWPDIPTPGTAMIVRLTAPGSSGMYGHEIVPPSSLWE